jgi:hypothetical protein
LQPFGPERRDPFAVRVVVFGERGLRLGEILGLLALSLTLLVSYGPHGTRAVFPLLHLSLLRIRTFLND